MPVWILGVFLVLGILLRVLAVFGYKHRNNQARTCRSALIADICLIALAGVQMWQIGQQTNSSAFPSLYCLLLLLSIVFTLLAIRGIKHDERLVRAADRLR